MKTSEYENYIFDFYGTICDIATNETSRFFWDSFTGFMKENGALYHSRKLQKAYLQACQKMTEQLKREKGIDNVEIDILDVFRILYDQKGIKAGLPLLEQTALTFRMLSTRRLLLFPSARDVLERLKKSGKKIYLLSNAQAVFTKHEMQLLQLQPYFDGILYSSDAGCKKPSEKFFSILFDRYGIAKESSVMIGNDSHDDVMGAHDFGISSIYIPSWQSSKQKEKLPDDCTKLGSISQLPDI